MEYRDQLKIIKSHKQGKRTGDKRKRSHKKEKPKKISIVDRFFVGLQVVASLFFLAALILFGIMPIKYLVIIVAALFLLFVFIKLLQKKALKSGKKRGSGKLASIIISVLLVLVGLYVLKANAALDKIATGEESGQYKAEHAIDVTEQPFNVYISGIDVYGDIHQESRSDVNLIATVNPKTHRVLITTTPRDYYVTIPEVSGGAYDKLAHAGIYGIDASMSTLENLYDTEIPFYVRVNFTSVEEIVDVMGGVDVESELAFSTGEEAGLVMDVKKGKNHFNGKQALAFARERHNLQAGDNQRGKNQQALLTGMINKAMSPMILFRANGMMNSVAGNSETNMAEKQIKALLKMQLNDGKKWDIQSVAATGDDSGKMYCYSYKGEPLYVTVPDEESVMEIQGKIDAVQK